MKLAANRVALVGLALQGLGLHVGGLVEGKAIGNSLKVVCSDASIYYVKVRRHGGLQLTAKSVSSCRLKFSPHSLTSSRAQDLDAQHRQDPSRRS